MPEINDELFEDEPMGEDTDESENVEVVTNSRLVGVDEGENNS